MQSNQRLVLPVEDERIVARDLQARLTRLGYEAPNVASSKAEAIQLVEHCRPDLVLMDITLHGRPEGIDAAREIRERFDLPVIYLTAHSDRETLEHAKLTEPFGYILKPFEDRELMVAIETAMHKHEAEKRLRQTERWLAATLCSIGDAVITLDLSLQVTFMNRVAEELTGWTTTDAIGKDLFSVFHLAEETAESSARNIIAKVLQKGTPSELEHPILIRKSGSRISVSDSVAPILDERCEIAGIVLVFRDVTEKERAEREIREQGEQQAAANRLAQRALASFDLQALMDEACAQVCLLLHGDVCEFLELTEDRRELRRRSSAGCDDGVFQVLPIADSVRARQLLDQSEPGIVHRMAADDPFLDRHWANSAAAVIVGVPEKPYGVLAAYSLVVRRFTDGELEFLKSVAFTLSAAVERMAMENRLRETEQMKSIGVLAGGVAHDFNNLLAVIMGNAEEGRRECRDCPPMCEIVSTVERASDLTRQLLAYAGKGHFVSRRFNLSDLVSESAGSLRRSVRSQIAFDFELAKDLPVLEADPNQIRQILANLVTNANEAISRDRVGRIRLATGSFELTAERTPTHSPVYSAAPGLYVWLEVADDGCGIDEAAKARIFVPFFSTKFTGRGLGLAGVQGIVRGYRGYIQVDSTPGSGSTFRICLPAYARTGAAEPVSGASHPKTGSSNTVLVIDDEAALRKMLVRMVQRIGFQTLEAGNGMQALEVLATAPVKPMVVFLDLAMPVMGAAELLPLLHARCPGLKVIAISGYTEQDALTVLLSDQIAGFLQKPFKREVLYELLTKAMN